MACLGSECSASVCMTRYRRCCSHAVSSPLLAVWQTLYAVIIVIWWLEDPSRVCEHHLPIGSENDPWTLPLVQPDVSWRQPPACVEGRMGMLHPDEL